MKKSDIAYGIAAAAVNALVVKFGLPNEVYGLGTAALVNALLLALWYAQKVVAHYPAVADAVTLAIGLVEEESFEQPGSVKRQAAIDKAVAILGTQTPAILRPFLPMFVGRVLDAVVVRVKTWLYQVSHLEYTPGTSTQKSSLAPR